MSAGLSVIWLIVDVLDVSHLLLFTTMVAKRAEKTSEKLTFWHL
jgi:hypothetical protein